LRQHKARVQTVPQLAAKSFLAKFAVPSSFCLPAQILIMLRARVCSARDVLRASFGDALGPLDPAATAPKACGRLPVPG
jgi:hypothetical protein